MPRRRPKTTTDRVLGALPPFIGLFVLGWAFSPSFRLIAKSLLWIAAMVVGLVLVALIVRKIIRHRAARIPDPSTLPATSASQPTTATRIVAPYPPSSRSPDAGARDHEALRETPSAWSPDLLRLLEWKRFEELVCAYICALGLEARTTRMGADGGVDVEVIDPATMAIAIVVQCKAWNTYQVGIKPVRELYGVMASRKVPQAAFFTTGVYTAEALAFGKDNDVDLVDGEELLRRINQLGVEKSNNLLRLALAGDYRTPTCPSCGVKMVLRTASRGSNEGSEFWGCPNYPRCRQTFVVSRR